MGMVTEQRGLELVMGMAQSQEQQATGMVTVMEQLQEGMWEKGKGRHRMVQEGPMQERERERERGRANSARRLLTQDLR